MPACKSCLKHFDVEKKPGAVFIKHPKTIHSERVLKWHICQECEKIIISRFKKK